MNEAAPFASPFPARAFQVLILEPSEKLSTEIISALTEARPGTSSAVARSVAEAQRLVIEQKPKLFVIDVDADYTSAQEFLYDLRTSHPDARAIILTASHFSGQREKVAGLGGIHFLEKPFPRGDFIALAEALLAPADNAEGERFQGTLSDLHIADIIQLKCISGATSMLEFTDARGEKARVYFEHGQVRHATAPGKEGREAFTEIVDWKGGLISEVPVPAEMPRTIDLDWQVLLMEAVRKIDETQQAEPDAASATAAPKNATRKVLVIDDSGMLLSFVKEILTEHHLEVSTASTAEEGLRACQTNAPDLVLLDYILPDMKGDEVCRKLVADPSTAKIPVVYMSGFGSDLEPKQSELPNVIGSLSKPFTSDALISAVDKYLPVEKSAPSEEVAAEPAAATPTAPPTPAAEEEIPPAVEPPSPAPVSLCETESKGAEPPVPEPEPEPLEEPEEAIAPPIERPVFAIPAGPIRAIEPPPLAERVEDAASGFEPMPESGGNSSASAESAASAHSLGEGPLEEEMPPAVPAPENNDEFSPAAQSEPSALQESATLPDSSNAYFCGDSSFFSLHWALQTIAREKLTGILRAFWTRETVELLARDGKAILVTTRNPQLYCEEAPVTLLNVDQERVEAARAQQAQDGCPIFISLAEEGLILREPGMQLVHHYGQKLFAQLWTTERVRFVFTQQELPAYARDLAQAEENIDQWALSTLRFVQYQELGKKAMADATDVPAYTRDGYERVQQLRLTVAEAQFASQFNGSRSVAQISKNLRLDIKFARLTLFRFLALEIVECWPVQVTEKAESRGGLRGIFGR